DMQMPEMDGLQFLQQASELAPDTVRMMLTGNADQTTAVKAINTGAIYRFLNKPCPPDEMMPVLAEGLEQYRLATVEKELLSKTLTGSVRVLMDVLAIAKPVVFGRSANIRNVVSKLGKELNVDNAWECEISAMLSQIGCVGIQDATLTAIFAGQQVRADEQETFENHPAVGSKLIAAIPRLSGVAEVVRYQNKQFDGGGHPDDNIAGQDIPIGSRILRLATDFVALGNKWNNKELAIAEIESREGVYDPELIELLVRVEELQQPYKVMSIDIYNIPDEGVVLNHILTRTDDIVVQRGTELNLTMRQRLKGVFKTRGVKQPIQVFVPKSIAHTVEEFQPTVADNPVPV
ncbi:MAG: HD domain-containing phosphohydrolase, partial [Pirellulaceae bacterium]|nr:HD domain-containing phosphohydrolase [Pirellulaceae bacterium]